MSEFFNVLPPDEARELLLRHVRPIEELEEVHSLQALHRVTARPIRSPQALPAFRRSTMDGFAVQAADTFGASESLPAFLRVVAEVGMGQAAQAAIRRGEAVVVHTGGMLPETADAVVPVEYTQRIGDESQGFPYEIEVSRSFAVGQNVLQVGEDVGLDEEVLPQGHLVRPQDVGGLLALGITRIAVVRKPHVAVLSTGDELVAPDTLPGPGQVRDINSFSIAAQISAAGGEPHILGIIRDRLDELLDAAKAALANSDMLVISAGSSVSTRDMTVSVVSALGEPGVLLHGVATRPGKPTIVGAVGGKPVLGLPGNPVSAMIQFDMFGRPAVHYLLGHRRAELRQSVWGRLALNVPSESGREDYVPARLESDNGEPRIVPVFGKSNLIYTLVRADGVIKVPLNRGGLLAGELVELILF